MTCRATVIELANEANCGKSELSAMLRIMTMPSQAVEVHATSSGGKKGSPGMKEAAQLNEELARDSRLSGGRVASDNPQLTEAPSNRYLLKATLAA